MPEDGNVINMLPPAAIGDGTTFGSMSREDLLNIAKNPPRASLDRGGSAGFDPMGRVPKMTSEQIAAARQTPQEEALAGVGVVGRSLQAARVPASGTRCYHRKHKAECTIVGPSKDKPGEVVIVRWDDGETSRAKLEFLTAIR